MDYDELRAKQLRCGNLLLPDGDHRREKQYLMPSPDARSGAYESLYDRAWHSGADAGSAMVTVSREDLRLALSLADGYLTLTTYPLGQEHCVGKLRDIWRARRAEEMRVRQMPGGAT